MYPTPDEAAVIGTVEAFMVETMARYDPSHDALHGESVKSKETLVPSSSILHAVYSPTRSQDGTEAGL